MQWKITETNQVDPTATDRMGNKFLIGNGYIGYRGTLEEYGKDQKTATIVCGLYDKVGELWREPVNLPNGCFLQCISQDERLHAQNSRVLEHEQGLNLYQAVHERKTTFETASGAHITIRARRFASLARLPLICMEITLQADRDCQLTLQTGIDGDVWDLNGPHLRDITSSEQDGIISLSAVTHENGVPVAVSEMATFAMGTQSIIKGEKNILRAIQVPVRSNQACILYKFVAHATGLDSTDPLADSQRACREAAVLGFDRLMAEHCTLWAQRWAACDIQIEGDEPAQEALRFSMYALLAIAPVHADAVSIPARGLSGQVYKGAIFWDTEIFMLPFFSCAFPAIARNLLMYRYHTLEGARRKAREYGFRGAFYAWESQDGGEDACTLFNVTDVFTNRPLRTYFRDKQVHISADIVYAIWQYFTITGDQTIWADGGAEVVFECARFYLSYTYFNPDKQRYEILDVTGPDEYHERVHNNFFTNLMVAHTLSVCRDVAAYLQAQSPEKFRDLMASLDFEHDLSLIRQVSENIFLPVGEAAVDLAGVIPQFDGFFKLENISLPSLLERKLHPHEYLGGGNGLATTTQIIKQADVILALYLFKERYRVEIKSANWEYYEPRTEHGSTLSACSYSMVAAQIGKVDWAYRYFMKTATIDLTGEGKEYVGTLYIGGTHPAGNGGAWMAAIFGLCGISWEGQTLSIAPRLPTHWIQVTFPLVFQGQKLRLRLSNESVCVQIVEALETPLFISVEGAVQPLPLTGELSIPLVKERPG
jgi:trehalose/maltose hydrolase-like predicted phosphorylase